MHQGFEQAHHHPFGRVLSGKNSDAVSVDRLQEEKTFLPETLRQVNVYLSLCAISRQERVIPDGFNVGNVMRLDEE